MDSELQDAKKLRKAELITPPNRLKEKVGSGGLNETTLAKAQGSMESSIVDFQPVAQPFLDMITRGLDEIKTGNLAGEKAVETLIYPAMQLKAQGTMFSYPCVTDIGDVLVNFLEVVPNIDQDVIEIVVAHKRAINSVIVHKLKGDNGRVGKELKSALIDACNRYYAKQEKRRKKPG
jgi:hypothetical protein